MSCAALSTVCDQQSQRPGHLDGHGSLAACEAKGLFVYDDRVIDTAWRAMKYFFCLIYDLVQTLIRQRHIDDSGKRACQCSRNGRAAAKSAGRRNVRVETKRHGRHCDAKLLQDFSHHGQQLRVAVLR